MKTRSQVTITSKPEPQNTEEWRAFLGDVAAQRHDRLVELEVNGGRRRDLAYAAASGQDGALKAAAALADRSDSIHHELALLQIAEDRAQAEIAKLDTLEAARSRTAMIEEQGLRLAERQRLAGTVESLLQELATALSELERLGQQVSTAYFALGGERMIVAPLDRGAVSSRLSEFCFGLGLGQWLPVACANTKTPPSSFRQIESNAQAAYDIQQ